MVNISPNVFTLNVTGLYTPITNIIILDKKNKTRVYANYERYTLKNTECFKVS